MKIQITQHSVTRMLGVRCDIMDQVVGSTIAGINRIPSLPNTPSRAHGDLEITHMRSAWGHDEVVCSLCNHRLVIRMLYTYVYSNGKHRSNGRDKNQEAEPRDVCHVHEKVTVIEYVPRFYCSADAFESNALISTVELGQKIPLKQCGIRSTDFEIKCS